MKKLLNAINRILISNKFLSSRNYIRYYAELGKQPKIWHFLPLAPRQVIRPERGFITLLPRIVRALSYSSDTLVTNGPLPDIEIMIACVEKDLQLLPIVIEQAVKNSKNKVVKISVIVPEGTSIGNTHIGILDVPILFISEDDVISLELREKLKKKFKSRYGWVLQQLLTIVHVMQAESQGVLVINADTLIIRPQVWLDSEEKQVLMPSFEYHKPYYSFLRKYGLIEEQFKCSHITHHMLMQPKYLRIIFNEFIGGNLGIFVEDIISYAIDGEVSPVCVEFELYALGMRSKFPEKVQMQKFANISVDPTEFVLRNLSEYGSYNSISIHSYIR